MITVIIVLITFLNLFFFFFLGYFLDIIQFNTIEFLNLNQNSEIYNNDLKLLNLINFNDSFKQLVNNTIVNNIYLSPSKYYLQ